MFRFLSRLTTRRPGRVVLLTVVFAVVAGVLGGPVAGLLTSGRTNFEDPGSPSVKAQQWAERATGVEGAPGLVALVETPAGARSEQGRARVAAVARTLAADRAVGRVADAARGGGAGF